MISISRSNKVKFHAVSSARMVDENTTTRGVENNQVEENREQDRPEATDHEDSELTQSQYDSEEDLDEDETTEPDSDYADEIEERR